MTYQQIIVVGNVGRDPELKYTPSGIAVADFSLAVNRSWTNQDGERQERTTWWRVTCWRKQAEIVARYVKKGRQVMVISTQIEADAYTSRDGDPCAALKITADEVRFLSGGSGGGSGQRPPASDIPATDDEFGDVPF